MADLRFIHVVRQSAVIVFPFLTFVGACRRILFHLVYFVSEVSRYRTNSVYETTKKGLILTRDVRKE